jgi:threonine dehydrogenase-like Zn-dependent dehydrogenase
MELIDIPLRSLRRGEVLIKVEACSVCGSDLEGYHGQHPTMKLPRVMGHEPAGTVVDVGEGVTSLHVGDRIAGPLSVSCGDCAACKGGHADRCTSPLGPGFSAHGAYAEYVIGSTWGCTPIPDGVTFIEAALAQPAAIANHAVATRAAVQAGEMLMIQGCGPIGLSAMLLAKLRGATVLSTDIVSYRCDLARTLGADLVLNAHEDDVLEAVQDWTQGRGLDKVIECVGGDQDETIAEAVTCVKRGGLVIVVGSFAVDRATLPAINFKFNEKTIAGSQSMPEGYGPIFELLLDGKLDLMPLVSHRLPLAQADHGLELMDAKAEQIVKAIIEPWS